MVRAEWGCVGFGDLGIALRAAGFVPHRACNQGAARSVSSFCERSAHWLDLVRGNHYVCVRRRETRAAVVDLSFRRAFPELVALDWRTRSRLAGEFDLVSLGRVHDCGGAVAYLGSCPRAK